MWLVNGFGGVPYSGGSNGSRSKEKIQVKKREKVQILKLGGNTFLGFESG